MHWMLLNRTKTIVLHNRQTVTLPNEPSMNQFLPVNSYFVTSQDKGVSRQISLHVFLETSRKKAWMIVNDWSEKGEKIIMSWLSFHIPMVSSQQHKLPAWHHEGEGQQIPNNWLIASSMSSLLYWWLQLHQVLCSSLWLDLGLGSQGSRYLHPFSTTAVLSWVADVALDCSTTVWKLTKVLHCLIALCQEVEMKWEQEANADQKGKVRPVCHCNFMTQWC
jgi:hypothetical protein